MPGGNKGEISYIQFARMFRGDWPLHTLTRRQNAYHLSQKKACSGRKTNWNSHPQRKLFGKKKPTFQDFLFCRLCAVETAGRLSTVGLFTLQDPDWIRLHSEPIKWKSTVPLALTILGMLLSVTNHSYHICQVKLSLNNHPPQTGQLLNANQA